MYETFLIIQIIVQIFFDILFAIVAFNRYMIVFKMFKKEEFLMHL